MSTKPALQSQVIPGLVMWPNGAIVRVEVSAKGEIVRDRNGRPNVLRSYARVTGEDWVAAKTFHAIEETERLYALAAS